ncbi:MAG TPA: response regulator [Verrucomicrobiae bacterium]|nr:response regulator [Verrucomicrobiae bacterium]
MGSTENDFLLEGPPTGKTLSAIQDDRPGFLLAEDTASKDLLVQRAFGAAGMADSLHVVADGETAIEYLRGCGEPGPTLGRLLPKVVLLDSKLPGKDGFEVLSWMRMQSHCRSLIIVIFTGLNREVDADRARAMGADFYLTKPNTFDELVKMTRCLYEWVLGKSPVTNSQLLATHRA